VESDRRLEAKLYAIFLVLQEIEVLFTSVFKTKNNKNNGPVFTYHAVAPINFSFICTKLQFCSSSFPLELVKNKSQFAICINTLPCSYMAALSCNDLLAFSTRFMKLMQNIKILALISFKFAKPKVVDLRSKICKVCNQRPFCEFY
jgi:hypothetical protein